MVLALRLLRYSSMRGHASLGLSLKYGFEVSDVSMMAGGTDGADDEHLGCLMIDV
jgi:hypothetical protein